MRIVMRVPARWGQHAPPRTNTASPGNFIRDNPSHPWSISLRMSQLRGDYKSVWNSLSGSKRDAYLVVSGYTDEDQFHADAEDTIDILRETVGVRPDDVFLEIGC